MSTREDELLAVKERIEVFAVKLRGRDSGGDNGTGSISLSCCFYCRHNGQSPIEQSKFPRKYLHLSNY